MRLFLLLCFTITFLSNSYAQQFIDDAQMESTVMANDSELKILYFTASWCGPCRMMKPSIEKIASDPSSNATIYKMDIDSNITDNIMGIPGVPTFAFIKNGKLLGQHTGALPYNELTQLFEDHQLKQPTGDRLNYKPVPSRYRVVAGAHPKLTKKNLSKLWNSGPNLNKTAWSIYTNLNDKRDLAAGLMLVNRAIELNESTGLLYLKVNYLRKMGKNKEALATAGKTRKLMVNNKEYTGDLDKVIAQLRNQG